MAINPVNLTAGAASSAVAQQTPASSGSSFSDVLKQAVDTVNDSVQTADQKVTDVANGSSNEDLHNVMIAMQKADVMLRTAVQVRDRVVDAYQEIMRMQI
ncbi:MAG: flagellar hook-basal body complex protein FliE [Sporolactobacillus sp.]|jgi:flagellar hook-basal body complex protein FliE|nr:flagellar hook-basal body complex protein FliE [Sporolactobacillus sp.]